MTETPTVRTKDKVLQLIAAHGVPIHNVDELRELWGPFPPHARELTRVLWDLQKQGEVKFNEIKAGRDSLLTKIRLSRGIEQTVFRSNESRGRHAVGKDYTDEKNHHWIAKGGPIEKIKVPMEAQVTDTYSPHGPKPAEDSKWTDYVAKVKPDRVRPILPHIAEGTDRPVGLQRVLGYSSPRITTLVSRAEQLGWITKEKVLAGSGDRPGVRLHLTDEGRRLSTEAFSDEGSRGPRAYKKRKEASDMQSDTPTQYPASDTTREYPDILQTDAPIEEVAAAARAASESTPATVMTTAWPRIIDVVELEKYPLISDLMTKEERLGAYEAAAKLLEGFDADLALSLLEKIQLTPLESEVIAFVRSLR